MRIQGSGFLVMVVDRASVAIECYSSGATSPSSWSFARKVYTSMLSVVTVYHAVDRCRAFRTLIGSKYTADKVSAVALVSITTSNNNS